MPHDNQDAVFEGHEILDNDAAGVEADIDVWTEGDIDALIELYLNQVHVQVEQDAATSTARLDLGAIEKCELIRSNLSELLQHAKEKSLALQVSISTVLRASKTYHRCIRCETINNKCFWSRIRPSTMACQSCYNTGRVCFVWQYETGVLTALKLPQDVIQLDADDCSQYVVSNAAQRKDPKAIKAAKVWKKDQVTASKLFGAKQDRLDGQRHVGLQLSHPAFATYFAAKPDNAPTTLSRSAIGAPTPTQSGATPSTTKGQNTSGQSTRAGVGATRRSKRGSEQDSEEDKNKKRKRARMELLKLQLEVDEYD